MVLTLLVGCLRGLDDPPDPPPPDFGEDGLRFASARTVEGYVSTRVATGGRTTVSVSASDSSLSEIAVEVDEGFEVVALESTERSATVELRATDEASWGELRIVDDWGVIDATPLVSRAPVRTRVLPVVGLGSGAPTDLVTLELGTWALWHEVERLTVAFASYDADDERLVDLDLAKSSNAPEPEGAPQSGWDSMALDVRGVEWLALEAGGRRVTIPRETRVDGIARVPHPFLTCFVATHAGVPVVGVPLTVSSDGGAPEAAGGPREGWPYLDAPCAVRG
ncbi:MAG: hypothetical protein KC586_05650, partial [Myxococcales bacterium]|nr:hypothetical protein [Myxococcales bacterium]